MPARVSRMPGSSVGPSAPQLAHSSRCGRRDCPRHSPHCALRVAHTSASVKPSCAVMKLTEAQGRRARRSNRSADPAGARRTPRAGRCRRARSAARRRVSAVPLGEAGRMLAELVTAGADVPRLGNQLDPRESGPGVWRRRSRCRGRSHAPRGRASRRGRSGSRRYGMVDPVAQRVHHHLQHARVGQVERVAGAGVVDAVARIVRTSR